MQDEYDIIHFGNLSQHLGIKMKLGKFSPYLPHGRHSHLYVDMIELATGRRKVSVLAYWFIIQSSKQCQMNTRQHIEMNNLVT